MKHIKISLLIIALFTLSGCNLLPPNKNLNNSNSEIKKEEKVTITGKVQENKLGCTVDGLCSLIINSDKGLIEVGYAIGRSDCNQQAADVGIELKTGDQVKIFAIAESENYLSTCESNEYYIKKLN